MKAIGLRVGLLFLGLAGAALLSAGGPADAGSECERLRRAISEASHNSQGGQYQAAAERQRGEIDRTVAYAQQLGCDNHKFLFFGSDPPPQCADIRAKLGRMRANLDDLQARAGGGAGGRGELIARYNAECADRPTKSPSLIDALFGQPKGGERPAEVEEQPLGPGPDAPRERDRERDADAPERIVEPAGEARAGGEAVCVRSCDGGFFPVSYSASSGRLDQLGELCRALCPATEVTLYTMPVNGQIEQAVSINGAKYADSPTALRYRKTFDSSCSCRRRGQTWASVLGPAEQLLGNEKKTDIIVDPKKAAELSKPTPPDPKAADPKAKAAKTPKPSPSAAAGGATDANGVDMALRDATATISREGSGIGGAAELKGPVGENQGQTFDETGPDGVKKKVRVISN